MLVVGLLLAVCVGALVLGGIARGREHEGEAQRVADLAALAAARTMQMAYPRLYAPPRVGGAPNPEYLARAAFAALARAAARRVAAHNDAHDVAVELVGRTAGPPLRVRVVVRERVEATLAGAERELRVEASATAELAPDADAKLATGGGYDGPLANRQGKPMRPDVAMAFDRMERAARGDGISLSITSAFRSDAEQAALWARNPDPRWVAPPGRSLHRLGTELDLGPSSAYRWLAANGGRFGFVQRYAWEPWHWGLAVNARSRPSTMPDGAGAVPAYVPARWIGPIARAAQRWNVSAALLAAQLQHESRFDPHARSRAGAAGIAQFMPGTARAYGLRDPYDPEAAIDAQAHLMRDLLARFASVPLALAAYNAGPAAVADCSCIPPYPETRAYVAAILGLMGGEGMGAGNGFVVRLVE